MLHTFVLSLEIDRYNRNYTMNYIYEILYQELLAEGWREEAMNGLRDSLQLL